MPINKALLEKIKPAKDSYVSLLEHSFIFNEKLVMPTSIPAINIALSGSPQGGLQSGILMIAGPSKHFKSLFGLIMVKAFLTQFPEGAVLFYDTEFGTPRHYFESLEIPMDHIMHIPISNIDEMEQDLVQKLKTFIRNEPVMIFIDSIGNIASLKEITDAEKGESKVDLTRAKDLKGFFRKITPSLNIKNIPAVIINHTYKEIVGGSGKGQPRDIVSGGTGAMYNSNDVWTIGRQQEKDSKDGPQTGWNFMIRIEKSRSVQEKSIIPLTVTFDGGIQQYSGLFDMAIEAGIIINKGAWFTVKGAEKNVRRSELEDNPEFWDELIKNDEFIKFVKEKYQLNKNLIVYDDAESPE